MFGHLRAAPEREFDLGRVATMRSGSLSGRTFADVTVAHMGNARSETELETPEQGGRPSDTEGAQASAIGRSQRSRRCDNPLCTRMLAWDQQPGRLPRFCGDTCRHRATADLRQLTQELSELQAVDPETLTYRASRRLTSELARTQWLLSAFPLSMTHRRGG